MHDSPAPEGNAPSPGNRALFTRIYVLDCAAARWSDRAVLYTDFLAELRKASLSVREFAELVGMNPNSISNYARSGELPTHIALIAVLVAGVGELGGDYRRVMARVERVRKKPRGTGRRGRFGGARAG